MHEWRWKTKQLRKQWSHECNDDNQYVYLLENKTGDKNIKNNKKKDKKKN